MKNKNNKKVVSTIKNIVKRAVIKKNLIEKKGSKIIKNVEKEWKASKQDRTELGSQISAALNDVQKNANKIVKNTNKISKDIATGFKQGVKAAGKKVK